MPDLHVRTKWEIKQALDKLAEKGVSVSTTVNYAITKYLKEEKDKQIAELIIQAEQKLELDRLIEQADYLHSTQKAVLRHSKDYIDASTVDYGKLRDGELSVAVKRLLMDREDISKKIVELLNKGCKDGDRPSKS